MYYDKSTIVFEFLIQGTIKVALTVLFVFKENLKMYKVMVNKKDNFINQVVSEIQILTNLYRMLKIMYG